MTSEISLARGVPFSIGRLAVDPVAREVALDNERQTIEPRVMQVLVALAEERGSVVPRDKLAVRCWGGRAISEDALNRAIGKVRLIAAGIGQGSFQIETVTKVGYRLRLEIPEDASLSRADIIASSRPSNTDTLRPGPSPSPVIPAVTDLETRGLSLLFQATADQTAEGVNFLRQAAIASPDRASLWGSLAMGYILSLSYTDAALIPQALQRAEEAANRALALDPHDGRALAAQISLRPTFGHWAQKDELLQRSLALVAADTPPLMFQRVQFLASVGRIYDALVLVERLSSISPLVPWIQSARANLLAAAGRHNEAQQVTEAAAQIWPRDRLTWFTKFNLALFGGRQRDALAMSQARAQWPEADSMKIELLDAAAQASIEGSIAARERVVEELAKRARDDRAFAEMGVQLAAFLGCADRALNLAREMYCEPGVLTGRGEVMPKVGFDDGNERNTALLFLPPVYGLRAKPEFAKLAAEIGLASYWQRANIEPPFLPHE